MSVTESALGRIEGNQKSSEEYMDATISTSVAGRTHTVLPKLVAVAPLPVPGTEAPTSPNANNESSLNRPRQPHEYMIPQRRPPLPPSNPPVRSPLRVLHDSCAVIATCFSWMDHGPLALIGEAVMAEPTPHDMHDIEDAMYADTDRIPAENENATTLYIWPEPLYI